MNYEIPVNCFTYAEIFLIKNYQWNSMDISITCGASGYIAGLDMWICHYWLRWGVGSFHGYLIDLYMMINIFFTKEGYHKKILLQNYCQTSNNTSCTFVGNKIVDLCRCYSNYIFILDLTPGFIGMGNDNCKKRWESFKFCDLVQLILEILQYNFKEHSDITVMSHKIMSFQINNNWFFSIASLD